MGSAGRSNLNVNGDGTDAIWFDKSENMTLSQPFNSGDFLHYEGWDLAMNYIPERHVFSTETTGNQLAYGQTIKFQLDKKGDTLGRMQFALTRGAVVGSSDVAFETFEAYSSIEYVAFIYNNKCFYKLLGDQEYIDLMKKDDSNQRQKEAQQQYGFLTAPDRVVNAAGAVTWVSELRVPWAELKKRLPMIALPNKIEVRVKLRPLNQCCAGTTVTSCSITRAEMICYYEHLPQNYRIKLFNKLMAPEGLALKITTIEEQNSNLLTTAITPQKISLSNFNNATYAMHILIRTLSEIDGTSSSTLKLWNFILPSNLRLKDGGTDIMTPIYLNYDQVNNYLGKHYLYDMHQRMYPKGVIGFKVPTIPLCEEDLIVDSEYNSHGSRNFQRYNAPELYITFDSGQALGATAQCDIHGLIHNLLIFQKGDIKTLIQIPL